MITFAELNERYLREQLQGKSTHTEFCHIYRQHFASWTCHPSRPIIRQWHVNHASTPGRTNKSLGYLRAMYNWAINQELWDDENPTAGIKRHRTFSRERTMTQEEVRLIMNSLPFLWEPFAGILTVLMTTGCRLGEAVAMEWGSIDLDVGSWLKKHTKNGKPQRVPLPRQTCLALAAVPRKKDCPYVFVGQYNQHMRAESPWKMWNVVRRNQWNRGDRWPALRMTDVTLHDIRRTVASRLLEQGEPDRVIKAILNHHQSDVTSVYARASFDVQARALQKHADGLWGLVNQTGGCYDGRRTGEILSRQDISRPSAWQDSLMEHR